MANYQDFESWLKKNEYVSWKTYLGFMKQIENTLMVKDFDRIKSITVLQQLFKQLEVNRAFTARSKSDKDNILSGFRTYIDYIKQVKG